MRIAAGLGLLICIVLLGVFRLMIHPALPQRLDAEEITLVNLGLVADACRDYKRLTGRWPTSLSQLRWTVKVPSSDIYVDGWGREVLLVAPAGLSNTIWIQSYGADGLFGGVGLNADICTELH